MMLATIRDDTWNVHSMPHIIPNSKRWDYSDIPVVAINIIGPTQMVGVGHHLIKNSNPHPRHGDKSNTLLERLDPGQEHPSKANKCRNISGKNIRQPNLSPLFLQMTWNLKAQYTKLYNKYSSYAQQRLKKHSTHGMKWNNLIWL